MTTLKYKIRDEGGLWGVDLVDNLGSGESLTQVTKIEVLLQDGPNWIDCTDEFWVSGDTLEIDASIPTRINFSLSPAASGSSQVVGTYAIRLTYNTDMQSGVIGADSIGDCPRLVVHDA